MESRNLARIDLNLLLTLQVLLEEQSVSRTAERLFLTQPAISKALGRLREVFGEPLFTRSGRGLVPTPYAASLQVPLNTILAGISDLFVPEAFDPGSYSGVFNIAVNEFLDVAFLPLMVAAISSEAPGIRFNTRTQVENQLEGLEKGTLDFVLNLQFADIPGEFQADMLLNDVPCLFARKGHPLETKTSMDFSEVIEYPRVVLHLPDMDKLDMFRRDKNRTPLNRFWQAAFETESLITALSTITKTDFILAGPGLLKHFASRNLNFIALDMKLRPDIEIQYCLVSHERVKNSAAHQWLRRRIRELATQLS